jgi:hypothetical protein
MEILQSLPPLVTLVLSLLLVVWLVLFLLVPFMLESIRSWTRRNHAELAEINKKLDRIAALLQDKRVDPSLLHDARADVRRESRGQQKASSEGRGDRSRREPTISG